MPVSQQALTTIWTPKIFVATGTTPTELATAVQTQVNTLVKQLVSSASGQTAGSVKNDSIIVHPAGLVKDTNNAATYYASITWLLMATPT